MGGSVTGAGGINSGAIGNVVGDDNGVRCRIGGVGLIFWRCWSR